MTRFKQYNFVCLSFFWVTRNEKKTFLFCLKKKTTSFVTCLTLFFFFVFVRKNKFTFCLALNKEKSNSNFLYLFLLFFCFPNDDNWWQVGRWYGITNLVMTWWLGWVMVTKWSKCLWRHIEMVPWKANKKKQFLHFFFFLRIIIVIPFFINCLYILFV